MDFSGVGAHFQNGVAERAIQTVTTWARAMMMHQLQHWPDEFDEALWPFAMDHAVHLWNNIPRHRSGLSPIELFTGLKQPQNDTILRARVWGCPAYALDPKLQDGHKLPKWKKRSRCGMYLGASPEHAESVGRILSLSSGAVTPQYHVVCDELFSTTFGALTDTIFDEDLWTSLLTVNGLDQGLENQLDERDRANPDVPQPAQDLFDQFCEDNATDSDDLVEDDLVAESQSPDSVPEGDGIDDDTFSPLDDTSSSPLPPRTRSGRVSKRGQAYEPTFSNAKRYI